MSFINYITEELGLSQIRSYMKDFNRERYDDIFQGEYRIYLPYEKTRKFAHLYPDKAKVNKDIIEYLDSIGFEIEDYTKGLAKNKSGRLLKIGRLLKNEPELLKVYENDP